MSYSFNIILGEQEPLKYLAMQFNSAKLVPLGQNVFLVALTEQVQVQMNGLAGSDVDGFEFLTDKIEEALVAVSDTGLVGYAEASSWAGATRQAGIIWQDGQRIKTFRFAESVINSILKYYGVVASAGRDEMGTMGFAERRFTDDWLEG
jgi:hypothetical protein